MKTVKYQIKFSSKASRLELLIRFLWSIPTAVVLCVLIIIGAVAAILQFLYILILGRRHAGCHKWIAKCMIYAVEYKTYANMLTDERSPIMPKK